MGGCNAPRCEGWERLGGWISTIARFREADSKEKRANGEASPDTCIAGCTTCLQLCGIAVLRCCSVTPVCIIGARSALDLGVGEQQQTEQTRQQPKLPRLGEVGDLAASVPLGPLCRSADPSAASSQTSIQASFSSCTEPFWTRWNRETARHVLGSTAAPFLKRAWIVSYYSTAWQSWRWTSKAIGTS